MPKAVPTAHVPGRKHAQGEDVDWEEVTRVVVAWGTTPSFGAIPTPFSEKRIFQTKKLWGHHSASKVHSSCNRTSEFCALLMFRTFSKPITSGSSCVSLPMGLWACEAL